MFNGRINTQPSRLACDQGNRKGRHSRGSISFHHGIAIDDWERVRWLIPLRAISNIAQLPRHPYDDHDGECGICGLPSESTWDPIRAAWTMTVGDCGEDRQVLENAMMVRWFNASVPPVTNESDIKLFDQVTRFIADADDRITAYKLAKLVKRQFKGQEETWRLFFETLGFAGVLRTDKQPGHLQQWTDWKDRAPSRAQGDARSPACYWRRELGFDSDVFHELFPECTLPKRLRACRDV